MTCMPASRRARATTLMPRSWPSRPTLARTTRKGGWLVGFFSGASIMGGSGMRLSLTPIVQDNNFVGERDSRPFEFSHGHGDVLCLHVTLGVIIKTDNQNARMTPT